MIPKEKARELYNRFYSEFLQFDKGCNLNDRKKYAIKGALLCVDEILFVFAFKIQTPEFIKDIKYWKKVTEELKQL